MEIAKTRPGHDGGTKIEIHEAYRNERPDRLSDDQKAQIPGRNIPKHAMKHDAM